jgi:uncharacterized DUF497 family protein
MRVLEGRLNLVYTKSVYEFRWNTWNSEHIADHGITRSEAEDVVIRARRPYPQRVGAGKYLAVGQTSSGSYIQVVYVFDPPGVVFVIHARPLREIEKRRFRRRRRGP